MSAVDRVQLFWEHVPRPFVERVTRSLFDCYIRADERCREFERSERYNLRPFYRRVLIEQDLRAVASRFSDQIVAEAVRHENKGFWYHTRIICNQNVALTQNTVPDPEFVVRNSLFRNCYARPNNQLYLFPSFAPEQIPETPLLYGILVHGRSKDSALFPGFAQVRFPKPKLTGYYEARIDLFEEFPEVVEEKTTGLPGSPPEEMELEPELLDEIDPGDFDIGGEITG
jgi:hypothetical protein